MMYPVLCAVLLTVATAAPGVRWFEMSAAKTLPQKNKTCGLAGLQLDLKPYSLSFEYFKDRHMKLYGSEDEHNIRRAIFEQNAKIIEKHNYLYSKGLKSYSLGINEYADMTLQEFNEKMKGFRIELREKSNRTNSGCEGTFLTPNNVVLPSEVDWRDHGYVTPVKNQGQCGSCWSFSTTGSLEGQHFRKTGKLISLSEQQLVDCSDSYGDQGCNGGLMDNAFQYIHDCGGIESEKEYPYLAKQERKCKFSEKKEVATVAGCTDVESESESALKQAVGTIGPVSIAIDASHSSFQLYHDGVYDEEECSSTQLDHGVLAVGYGTDPSDYWLVKNSWGETWGQQGYIKMSRNKNNQCGVATQASYPNV